MRRVPPPEPTGWLFNGVRYETDDAYLAARAKWQARRARLLALIEGEREHDDVGRGRDLLSASARLTSVACAMPNKVMRLRATGE